MKASKALLLSLVLPLSSFISTPAFAVSQDECAIWLCLPSGFPAGCEAAHSAMHHRIKHGKSALPPFEQCAVDQNGEQGKDDEFSTRERFVLHIREHQECTQWKRISTKNTETRQCVSYKIIPEHYRPGRSCYLRKPSKDDEGQLIPGCAGVYREISVLQYGKQFGKPFYYR